MAWVTVWGVRRALLGTAMAGVVVVGVGLPANAGATAPGIPVPAVLPAVQDDPACDWLGWRHPLCAGGLFDSPPDDGRPGDNAAIGGIPAPAMVPNVNGTLSPPGTPGAV